MNNRLNASSFNQNLHQPALEHSTGFESTLADLQPISDLTEGAAYTNRVGTSASPDLRSPSTATPITQGRLKQNRPDQALVPVPPEFRRPNEDDSTRITLNALSLRKFKKKRGPVLKQDRPNPKRVPVPPELRRPNEDDNSLINPSALRKRKEIKKLVQVSLELRFPNEDDNTLITFAALQQRKMKQPVPIPPEFRLHNEDDNTRITLNALKLRKFKKKRGPVLKQDRPNPKRVPVPPGEARHPLHQSGEISAANTLADSHGASRNSQSSASPRAGSNEPLMHETTQQDRIDAFELPDPLCSDTAFSYWIDDFNAQQSTIDHLFIDQDLDDPGTGGPL